MRGLPGVVSSWRATSTGPWGPTWVTITALPWRRTHTVSPPRRQGTEYRQPSSMIVGWAGAPTRGPPRAAGLAEGRREGRPGQPVEPLSLVREHLDRMPPGDPVGSPVELLA